VKVSPLIAVLIAALCRGSHRRRPYRRRRWCRCIGEEEAETRRVLKDSCRVAVT